MAANGRHRPERQTGSCPGAVDGRTASLRRACSDGATHATCGVQHQLLDPKSWRLPNATKMEGLRLLKLRRRQPTAPAFGAARGPRFVHATTSGTDAGYGARLARGLPSPEAPPRRRRRGARRGEQRYCGWPRVRDDDPKVAAARAVGAIWRRALSRTGVLSGWMKWRAADRDLARLRDLGRRALSLLRKKCGDGQLFAKWIVQTQKCREGSRLSAALHKIARRKMRIAMRCWRTRLEVLRRNARLLGNACRKWRNRVGLARGWSRWRRFIVTGKVTKRLLRLKLAQGFGRWAQATRDLRAAELRKNECAKRVVEVLFRYRGRQEQMRVLYVAPRAPAAKARPARRRAKPRAPGARRPVLLRLRDERRLLVHLLQEVAHGTAPRHAAAQGRRHARRRPRKSTKTAAVRARQARPPRRLGPLPRVPRRRERPPAVLGRAAREARRRGDGNAAEVRRRRTATRPWRGCAAPRRAPDRGAHESRGD